MEYLIGVVLALVVCVFALLTGYDRGRVFYPTVLTVVGTYYILFATMGGSNTVLTIESLVACVYIMLGVVGFKKSLWVAAAGLVGHGGFDFVHHMFIQNAGMPLWWPGFCGSFDVLAGVFLAFLLLKRPGFAISA